VTLTQDTYGPTLGEVSLTGTSDGTVTYKVVTGTPGYYNYANATPATVSDTWNGTDDGAGAVSYAMTVVSTEPTELNAPTAPTATTSTTMVTVWGTSSAVAVPKGADATHQYLVYWAKDAVGNTNWKKVGTSWLYDNAGPDVSLVTGVSSAGGYYSGTGGNPTLFYKTTGDSLTITPDGTLSDDGSGVTTGASGTAYTTSASATTGSTSVTLTMPTTAGSNDKVTYYALDNVGNRKAINVTLTQDTTPPVPSYDLYPENSESLKNLVPGATVNYAYGARLPSSTTVSGSDVGSGIIVYSCITPGNSYTTMTEVIAAKTLGGTTFADVKNENFMLTDDGSSKPYYLCMVDAVGNVGYTQILSSAGGGGTWITDRCGPVVSGMSVPINTSTLNGYIWSMTGSNAATLYYISSSALASYELTPTTGTVTDVSGIAGYATTSNPSSHSDRFVLDNDGDKITVTDNVGNTSTVDVTIAPRPTSDTTAPIFVATTGTPTISSNAVEYATGDVSWWKQRGTTIKLAFTPTDVDSALYGYCVSKNKCTSLTDSSFTWTGVAKDTAITGLDITSIMPVDGAAAVYLNLADVAGNVNAYLLRGPTYTSGSSTDYKLGLDSKEPTFTNVTMQGTKTITTIASDSAGGTGLKSCVLTGSSSSDSGPFSDKTNTVNSTIYTWTYNSSTGVLALTDSSLYIYDFYGTKATGALDPHDFYVQLVATDNAGNTMTRRIKMHYENTWQNQKATVDDDSSASIMLFGGANLPRTRDKPVVATPIEHATAISGYGLIDWEPQAADAMYANRALLVESSKSAASPETDARRFNLSSLHNLKKSSLAMENSEAVTFASLSDRHAAALARILAENKSVRGVSMENSSEGKKSAEKRPETQNDIKQDEKNVHGRVYLRRDGERLFSIMEPVAIRYLGARGVSLRRVPEWTVPDNGSGSPESLPYRIEMIPAVTTEALRFRKNGSV
jgi:hypothetical protein